MVGHAVMRACLDDDSSRLLGPSLRFAAPVLPGERLPAVRPARMDRRQRVVCCISNASEVLR
jgi:acyl dehydratase